MSLASDDLEHVVVVPGRHFAPTASAGSAAHQGIYDPTMQGIAITDLQRRAVNKTPKGSLGYGRTGPAR
jgi:hypothetical protein